MSREMKKYVLSLYWYDWHNGGMNDILFVEARNADEAFSSGISKYYKWLRSFYHTAYIEKIKIYEYKMFDSNPPIHLIIGPLLEIEEKITQEDAKRMEEDEFIYFVKEKSKKINNYKLEPGILRSLLQ